MSKVELFRELIKDFARDGRISDDEEYILTEQGKELGFSESSIQTMIQLELENDDSYSWVEEEEPKIETTKKYKFKSAITRLGPVLTPHIIEICNGQLTYKKRNKYLINVDSITISLDRISSVELDTSLLGTNIIIQTYGQGTIKAENFTISDAKKIRNIINECT